MLTLRPGYVCFYYLSVLLCLLGHVQTVQAGTGEYQIKSAMIYNMIRYMDWPEDTLPASASQITVCIVGKGGLGMAIGSLQGKQAKGKNLTVRQSTPSNAPSGCQVLVVSDLDAASTAGLLERTRSSAVLTVADSENFARMGGVVGFILQDGKVRFEINQTAALRHRIRISSQLLKLAKIVQDSP